MRRDIGLAAVMIVVCAFGQAHADQIEFFDDFNDGNADGWVFPYNHGTSQSPGVWSVENGTLVQHDSTDHHTALVDKLIFSDQLIEADVAHLGYAGVVLWYDQVVDGEWANYVAVNYNSQGGIWVHEAVDGDFNRYYYGGPWINTTLGFDLRIEADSATGELTIDGVGQVRGDVQEFSFLHEVSTPYRTGLSGVYSGNSPGYFDNFRLTGHVIPTPSSFTALIGMGLMGMIAVVRRRCKHCTKTR